MVADFTNNPGATDTVILLININYSSIVFVKTLDRDDK